jgi:cytochrome P450
MGEIFAMLPKDCHVQVAATTMAQKYKLPGVFYLDLWPVAHSICVITDPDVALHMTVTRNHEKHSEEAKAVDPMIGVANIVTSEGARWKMLHKMLAPAFSVMHVTNQRPMVAEAVMEFRAILAKLAESGETFEMEKCAERMTLDVIGEATFGHSLGAQAGHSEVMQHWEDMSRAQMQVRDGWKINFVRQFLAHRKREAAKKKLDTTLTELVEKRFAYVVENDLSLQKRKDSIIMDLILREYLQGAPQNNQKRLDPDFLEIVLMQVRTLVVGGTGTTTDTTCFTYMLLSAFPDVVRKLREEHDRVFAPGIDATYDILCAEPYRLNSLEYTTNVIKESLRLYPVGCTARREQTEGFIPYDGQQYTTKGFLLLPMQHTMHMNPEIFPNPRAFDPDRFTREDFPRHAWRPFERGPRACLGQPLAMDELKIMLLLTIRDFDFACVGLKPNKTPRVPWTDLDLTFGDRAFQEYVFEAKPRDHMPMSVKKSNWA